jgi:C-methyltransferase C-terminal domain/Putative zinc binding domain/Methyltransferase domain
LLPKCRLCGADLTHTFVDLGMSPLCESYVPAEKLDDPETFYPLHVRLCESCLLVQLPAYVPGEDIFSDYAYFSSYSDSWVAHAGRYAEAMVGRLGLDSGSLVTEVASNDGYLLQHFLARDIPVLGVEPAANVAEAARARGVRTVVQFLGAETGQEIAEQYGRADLVAGNNVFAHVPDIRGFAAGLRALVKDDGLVTLEFPHLLRLIERRQYDTIYHEHFSYLSLHTSSEALATAGLRVVDVDELSTHGGSLRVHARPTEAAGEPAERVKAVLAAEEAAGLHTVAGHDGFARQVMQIKSDLLGFLLTAAAEGRSVAGYGAPGKGNTLLNHCGIRSDLLSYTVDRSPWKQGKFLPGTHIPIYPPEHIAQTRPDYVLVLPWNLRDEISTQLDYVRSWGGRLVFPIPALEIA